MRRYKQLSRIQRHQVYSLLNAGLSKRKIALRLRRSHATIVRETRRNRGLRGYRPVQAQRRAHARRKGQPHRQTPLRVVRTVERLLLRDWSPEQISGRLARKGIRISHETIYRHVLKDKRVGGSLWTHLRCRKQRRKRYGRYDRRGRIPGRVGIEKRPAIVNARKRFGDWEVDTVLGRRTRGPVVVTAVERKSGLVKLRRVPRGTAKAVRRALVGALRGSARRVWTITADNGREFAEHAKIGHALKAGFYFARPYHAWERGANENLNGLLRQYLPKGSDFGTLQAAQLGRLERLLNSRPRKRCGFMTPKEVFSL
jgi:IS30 family transposase